MAIFYQIFKSGSSKIFFKCLQFTKVSTQSSLHPSNWQCQWHVQIITMQPLPEITSHTARCLKRQLSCNNKYYMYSCHNRTLYAGEVLTRDEYWNLYITLSCNHITLWKAWDANMVENVTTISWLHWFPVSGYMENDACCFDKNVKILVRY